MGTDFTNESTHKEQNDSTIGKPLGKKTILNSIEKEKNSRKRILVKKATLVTNRLPYVNKDAT